MRQMAKLECRILPILIDDVSPPASISHIKYANFKNWQLKEHYLEALQELLVSLEIKTHYSSSVELVLFQKNLHHLMTMMKFASSASQLYFQIERLWFSIFKRDPRETEFWLGETVYKTLEIDKFVESYQVFEKETADLKQNPEKIHKVLELCKTLENDYSFLLSSGTATPQSYYERIWKGEDSANELSALLYSITLELKGIVLP
jgi:hypothetical protein